MNDTNEKIRCYAAPHSPCAGPLSREHFITAAVLAEIGESLYFSGLPWLHGATRRLNSGAISSRILCAGHNSRLSVLDDAALVFFAALRRFKRELRDGSRTPIDEEVRVAGDLVERWMLKALIGGCCSGNAAKADGTPIRWRPPKEWLSILFGEHTWPPGRGMYVQAIVGTSVRSPNALEFSPTTKQGTHDVTGLLLRLEGLTFVLAAGAVPRGDTDGPLFGVYYRPRAFFFNQAKLLELHWPRYPADIVVHVDVDQDERSARDA